jgi:hypothetical protein
MVFSEPTTAKGIMVYAGSQHTILVTSQDGTNLDLRVECDFLRIMLLILIRIGAQVMERELLLYALLERLTLLQSERVALSNDRYHVDKFAELLENHNINRLQGMAAGLDEEQAAMDSGVLQISLALSSELLAQICRMLVLDILDDRIPAALVVDQVTVAGSIDNVEPQTNAILFNDVRHSLDLGRAADRLVWLQAALAVDKVRGEDRVDER